MPRLGRTYKSIAQRAQEWADRPDDCWLWDGAPTAKGYGRTTYNGRQMLAHRAMYEHLIGPVPKGKELDHLCRNRACMNPRHLEPVTHHENVLRGESPFAIMARRTHCARGHELSGANLKPNPKGYRICRECERIAQRKAERKYAPQRLAIRRAKRVAQRRDSHHDTTRRCSEPNAA